MLRKQKKAFQDWWTQNNSKNNIQTTNNVFEDIACKNYSTTIRPVPNPSMHRSVMHTHGTSLYTHRDKPSLFVCLVVCRAWRVLEVGTRSKVSENLLLAFSRLGKTSLERATSQQVLVVTNEEEGEEEEREEKEKRPHPLTVTSKMQQQQKGPNLVL